MAANLSPEVKAILKLFPDLKTALSNEPLSVANKFLSKGLILDEIYSKVLMPTLPATHKAAIMIESARKMIELTPSKFTEFLDTLSELNCPMLVESLRSTYQSESVLIFTHICTSRWDDTLIACHRWGYNLYYCHYCIELIMNNYYYVKIKYDIIHDIVCWGGQKVKISQSHVPILVWEYWIHYYTCTFLITPRACARGNAIGFVCLL